MDELKKLLARIEEPIDRGEDFSPYDWSGGNFDDAWTRGEEDGRRQLAAEIREILGTKVWVEFKGTCLPEPGAPGQAKLTYEGQ